MGIRARNIKPGFFKNEDLAALPVDARLLFIGLWCLADREGRLEDRPRRIKAELFPYENRNVDSLLSKLAGAEFIHRYTVGEGTYIQVCNFTRHQNPHKNEPCSIIPAPGDIGTLREHYQSPRVKARSTPADSLIPDSLIPDSGFSDSRESAREDHELLDELLSIAASIKSSVAKWEPSKADRVTLSVLAQTFPPEQLRREIEKFKAYCPQRDYKAFGRAFASWMGRVKPDPMTAPKPKARNMRIERAAAELEAGGDADMARAFVNDADEWQEAQQMAKGAA